MGDSITTQTLKTILIEYYSSMYIPLSNLKLHTEYRFVSICELIPEKIVITEITSRCITYCPSRFITTEETLLESYSYIVDKSKYGTVWFLTL